MHVRHALVAFLAVVAVTAPVAGAALAASHGPAQPLSQVDDRRSPSPAGTIAVLDSRHNVTNRSTVHGTYVDLGRAVSFGSNESSRKLLAIRAAARVREADNPTAALAAELERLESGTNGLGRSQRDALRAYASGDAGPRRTLVRLAHIDREARALDRRRERVAAAAARAGVSRPAERLAALERELDIYTGPVRAHAAAALTGRARPTRIYLAAAPRSVTLSTVTESAYLRETYRGDLRRTGGPVLNRSAATGIVARQYPTVWTRRERVSYAAGGNAVVEVDYDGGEFRAHIGTANRRVFRDVHRQQLPGAASNLTAVNTQSRIRMTVNRTYAGGPMRVRLTNLAGDPVNATVTMGPATGGLEQVGTTGPDGELWVVVPDVRFSVFAVRGNSLISLRRMDPLATPRAVG